MVRKLPVHEYDNTYACSPVGVAPLAPDRHLKANPARLVNHPSDGMLNSDTTARTQGRTGGSFSFGSNLIRPAGIRLRDACSAWC